MRLLQGLPGLRHLPPGAVLSIGNFDGIHLGHQHILSLARRLAAGAELAVATFEPHPFTVLRPDKVPPRLTPPPVKRELLERAGVNVLVELAPTRDVLDLTAEQFWHILRDEVRPSHMVEGSSFTFGKGRGGTIDTLRTWAAESAVRLHVVDPVTVPLLDLHVVSVSSSLIRWLVHHGRVRDAAICLARPYVLQGHVIHGAHRGRGLGTPTANLHCTEQLIPADGVYAGRCAVVDGATYPAAVSIGTNPTFGEHARQVEAHLIGFQGNLYDRELAVELLDWEREQWKFHSVDELKSQITRDLQWTVRRARADQTQWIEIDG